MKRDYAQVRELLECFFDSAHLTRGRNEEKPWFGFAQEIFDLQGAGRDLIRPTTSEKYQRPAPRPPYSVLGHDAWAKAGIAPIGDWRDSLRRAFPAVDATA